jgi:hypothetical protein
MVLSRVLALLVVALTLFASSMLIASCGGTDPATTDDGGTVMCTAQGAVDINQDCTSNCDCKDAAMVCTKAPYDRKVNPVCTYTCDLASPNPLCTMGCNMKGYCKLQ